MQRKEGTPSNKKCTINNAEKGRNPQLSTDAATLSDIPSSSAIMPLGLPSPVFNPEVELRWKQVPP
jgi:hypothetical protein